MKKERSRRIPLRAWLMYLLLLCFSVSGVTMSRYTTSSSGRDDARVASIRELTVTQTDRTYPIAPGADLSNDAAVHFGGSEMACYLFLQIDADGWTSKEDTFTYPDADRAWMTFSVADGWLPLPGYGTVFYRILPANTPLDAPVFSDGKITVSRAVTRTQLATFGGELPLRLSATAVQYAGFGEDLPAGYTADDRAVAAWTLICARS